MNPLICALAYCSKDVHLTQLLFDWINELGGCPGHACVLTVDSKVEGPKRAFIKMSAENAFDHVQEIEFTEPPLPKVLKWPPWRFYANQMFLRTANYVFDSCRLPFFWLESDAAPMSAGWLDAIAKSYYSQPMKFHGPLIPATAERMAHIPALHMAGVAVYPNTAAHILAKYCGGEHTWDLGGSEVVIPKASKCRLISHNYGPSEDEGWSFVVKGGKLAVNHPTQTYSVREDCVVFHRCKDGSLIRCLQELKKGANGHADKPELIGSDRDFVDVGQRPRRPRKAVTV